MNDGSEDNIIDVSQAESFQWNPSSLYTDQNSCEIMEIVAADYWCKSSKGNQTGERSIIVAKFCQDSIDE